MYEVGRNMYELVAFSDLGLQQLRFLKFDFVF